MQENVDKHSGIYLSKSNVLTFDEKTTWGYYNLCRAFGGNIASYRATGYEASLVQLFSWHVGRASKTLICHREIVGFHHSFLAKP